MEKVLCIRGHGKRKRTNMVDGSWVLDRILGAFYISHSTTKCVNYEWLCYFIW